MKTKNILHLCTVAVATMMLSTSCSDAFLEEKTDYSKVTSEIWEDYNGCLARINNIYTVVLPISTGESNLAYYPSSGNSDLFSTSTEEYASLSDFVNPDKVVDYSTVPDYFYYSRKTSEGMYGRIRNCNDAIQGISTSTGITEDERKVLLGQAYYFRAWLYYRLVKVYGGVPIVTVVQDPIAGNGDSNVSRSSTKVCIDFICSDLNLAAQYLPLKWDANNFGRVTSGTALALMGRTRLLYASPVFNRSDDDVRWEQAYKANKNALDTLKMGDFGLAYEAEPGINANGWAKMFSDYNSKEAVFVTLYNNVAPSGSTAPEKNNGWENGIRPSNAYGGGGKTPSAMIVDMFPMADGSKSSYCATVGTYTKLQYSDLVYNPDYPFLNRDPRFYRTFAFPGVKWQFKGSLAEFTATKDNASYPYQNGNLYELWNYAWYADTETRDAENQSGYGADGFLNTYKGFYIRKKSDDLQVNSSTLYILDSSKKFGLSAAPYIEMRYAEVLLNFAEAACGAGYYDEAVDALIQIRKRVGYTAENNYYGLGDLQGTTDRAKLFSAILYERQIELAFEGKRFDDMRRWMLFDGGVGQADLKATWGVTGFGGNTCTYLGIKPFNGQRRENMEFRVSNNISNGIGGTTINSDPLSGITRPAALDYTKDLATQVEALRTFYSTNLVRKTRRGDTADKFVTFKPTYYILGFYSSAMKDNPAVEQNIGWESYASGGAMGTFDPLAE